MLKYLLLIPLLFISSPANAEDTLRELATYGVELDNLSAPNAKLVAERLNGLKLLPNARWSFNAATGPRTPEWGFLAAPVFVREGKADPTGQGVHEAASALHASALLSGLRIIEWHPSVTVRPYIDPGLDAAVLQGSMDLQLMNTFSFPVHIRAWVRSGMLFVGLYGKEDPLSVFLRVEELQRFPQTTREVKREDWPVGRKKIIQYGIQAVRLVRERIIESKTGGYTESEPTIIVYQGLEKIVGVGTGVSPSRQNKPIKRKFASTASYYGEEK